MSGSNSIEVRCRCGRVYHADPAHAGRAIRCRCGREVPIRPGKSGKNPRASSFAWVGCWWRAPGLLTRSPRLQWLVAAAAWGYLAAVVAFTALLWIWGDRWWPATAALFGPRWVILLPIPLLFITAILIRPGTLFLLIAAALLAVGPAMGFRLGWHDWIRSGERDLRIITFNIESGANQQALSIPKDLQDLSPDVMVFQECDEQLGRSQYWPAGWTARFDHGLCFGSRYRLLATAEDEEIPTQGQGGSGIGRLYRIETPNGTVEVVVVHLETPRRGLEALRSRGNISRMEPSILVRDLGSRRISRWVERETRNAIIAGDFNMPVESRIYRTYWSQCENAFSTVGHGFGYTRVLKRFSVRIDHVLGCQVWQAVRAFVGPDLGSDHLPVVVDLRRTDR